MASRSRTATSRILVTKQHSPPSLAANVRRGAVWNVASTMLVRISSIGITAIVARILTPDDFGVFAVAVTAFTIVTAIGEFGVTTCLSRADLEVDTLAPTLWTVSLGTSFLSGALLWEFASPIATALGSAQAAGPIRVMSLLMSLWGLAAVPTAQCVRDFKQNKIFLANTLSFIPSTVVLVLLAKHGNGAMAFAWSRVAGQVTSCAVILTAVPKLHRPGISRAALSVLYRFGIPLAIANFVNYILQNVDYILIGHLMGSVPLGSYVLAFNAAAWSSSLLMSVLGTVAMPAFSRVKNEPARLEAAAVDAVRAVVLIAAPICAIVALLSRPLVLTLYGPRWVDAIPVLSLLSIYGFIAIVGVLFSNMLAAIGRSKSVLVIQLIWLAMLAPAMTLGVKTGGIVGAAIAHIIIIGPFILPCYLIALKKVTGIRGTSLARAGLPALTVALIAASLAWLTASNFSRPVVQLIVGLTVGGSLYILATAPQLIQLLGSRLSTRPAVRRILHRYRSIGRTVGIPVGPPPRHARRREEQRRRSNDVFRVRVKRSA